MPENSTDDTRTMIASPVAALLKSRKVIVALATALANIVVLAIPSLELIRMELVTVFTALGSLLIYAIMKEDVAEKGAPTTVTTGSAETVNVNQQPAPAEPPPTTFSRN